MSKTYEGRQRNQALRSLDRFDVGFTYENNVPVFRIRPKGYRTVIAELRGVPGAHPDDVLDVGMAVRKLAEVGAK